MTSAFQGGEDLRTKRPIRDLGLRIEGTRLQPLVERFEGELEALGFRRVKPRFYLSTEWGVAHDSVAIAIPFYLVDAPLTAYHQERVGHVEGMSEAEILKYLRHEMGHVINYAYRLYEQPEWTRLFGAMSRPYEEVYRPKPFSRSFVRHLPGWYAQKHPDEDFAESFAVWMTPGRDWRAEYTSWPRALEKLRYVDATMADVRERDPLCTTEYLDEPVNDLPYSVDQYYDALVDQTDIPSDLDALVRSVFPQAKPAEAARSAATLIRSLEMALLDQVFLWTGHFPERTRLLVRQMAAHAEAMDLHYATEDEAQAIVAVTTLVTALALSQLADYPP